MIISEVMLEIEKEGLPTNETQLRWAMKCGYVGKPRMDIGRRYDFTPENLSEILKYFASKQPAKV